MEGFRNLYTGRKEYQKGALSEKDVENCPVKQFSKWFHEVVHSGYPEPNAVSLATVSASGKPSVRIVLLKDYSEAGFVFYTNYRSRKAHDIMHNPRAAMAFYWHHFERQVRIEGNIRKVDAKISDEYFESRPFESRVGAIISEQSTVIESRQVLDDKFSDFLSENRKTERPRHWGGYLLEPVSVEFWQGRENRLHDRILYQKEQNGEWHIFRLAP